MKLLILAVVLVALVAAEPRESILDAVRPELDKIHLIPLEIKLARDYVPLYEVLGVPKSEAIEKLEDELIEDAADDIHNNLKALLVNVEKLQHDSTQKARNVLKGEPTKDKVEEFVAKVQESEGLTKALKETTEFALTEGYESTVTTYGIRDWWEKVKGFFKGLGSKISNKFGEFKNWAAKVYSKVIDASKPIANQIKDLAIHFVSQNWDKLTVTVVKQALSFFNPFAGIIGGAVMQKLIDLGRHFGILPAAAMLMLH